MFKLSNVEAPPEARGLAVYAATILFIILWYQIPECGFRGLLESEVYGKKREIFTILGRQNVMADFFFFFTHVCRSKAKRFFLLLPLLVRWW